MPQNVPSGSWSAGMQQGYGLIPYIEQIALRL